MMRWRERLMLGLCLAAAGGGCERPPAERFLTAPLGGWTRVGDVRHFTARNLYDHINGEADFVVSFGFRSMAQATYRHGSGAETIVDIYDMDSVPNAFALFRSRVTVEGQPLEVGSEAARDSARVEFWQGRFYVDLSIPAPEAGASVLALSRHLARTLPPTEAWPGYLKLLPAQGRVARSEQYLPSDFLGHEFLKRAVTARYKVAGRDVMLFACQYESPAEAADALARLEAALRPQRPVRSPPLAQGGFVGEEATLGQIAAFRRGRFLGGMTHYAKSAAGDALLADLDRCLGAQ